MTKDILLSITGCQNYDDTDDSIELVTTGKYYCKNGKHYILYEETLDGTEYTVNNKIKIADGCVQMDKKGITTTGMYFKEGSHNVTGYVTEFGEIMVGTNTKSVAIDISDDNINVDIKYNLEINGEHTSECNIKINVKSM